MKTISLVMIVRNEERKIERCLNSIYKLVDEIIVVDTGSIDNTKEIAIDYGAKVFDFVWNSDFSEARNYGLQQVTSDWIIVLDADEYIVNDCEHIIREFISGEKAIGNIKILSKTYINGEISCVQNFIPRIFPKGVFFSGRIHEQLLSNLSRMNVIVEVEHDGYFKSEKHSRNIPLLEKELADNRDNAYVLYQLAKEYKGLGDIQKAYNYIHQAFTLLKKSEIYAPLVTVDYLYISKKAKKFKEGLEVIISEKSRLDWYPDFHFASGLFYLELIISDAERFIHLFPRIEQAFLKCLEIGDLVQYDSVIGTGSFAALHNLGVYHEVQGQIELAISYYEQAATMKYKPSIQRLIEIEKL